MTGSGGFRRSVCQSNEGGSFSRSALVKRNQGKASAQRCWTKTLSQSSKRCPAATMVATSSGFGFGGSRDMTSVKAIVSRSEEHTSELQSHLNLVCRLLLEKKK